jgi:hypothetical protein
MSGTQLRLASNDLARQTRAWPNGWQAASMTRAHAAAESRREPWTFSPQMATDLTQMKSSLLVSTFATVFLFLVFVVFVVRIL